MALPLATPRRIKRKVRSRRRVASGRRDYNYFRDYDPATGRYIESDPIGLRGGINTYGYVRQNPIRRTDLRGLNPGDTFGTEEAAAQDALQYFRGLKGVDNWEYASAIYRMTETCKYSYTEPATDQKHGKSTVPYQEVPNAADWTADIHNHPSGMVLEASLAGIDPYEFSKDVDIPGNEHDGTNGYLITPDWMLRKYTPQNHRPTRDCGCESGK